MSDGALQILDDRLVYVTFMNSSQFVHDLFFFFYHQFCSSPRPPPSQYKTLIDTVAGSNVTAPDVQNYGGEESTIKKWKKQNTDMWLPRLKGDKISTLNVWINSIK